MRLLILCRVAHLYSCQRLKEAGEAKGYQVDILDPNRFLLTLEQGKFICYYQTEQGKKEKLADYQAVIPRFGITSTEMGCNVLNHFEGQNIPVLNNSNAFRLARHKWQSLQRLVAQGIAVPDSLLAGELYATSARLTHFPLPQIIKTLSGSQGIGVMLAENQATAKSLMETLQAVKIQTLQQRFIEEAKGQDIRAFVIGDQVVATMERTSQNGDFRANIHQGGVGRLIELSDVEKQLVIQASQAIGLEVAGVDLIRSHKGLMVLEVNASPGLEMIETVSKMDIAGLMIEKVVGKCQ